MTALMDRVTAAQQPLQVRQATPEQAAALRERLPGLPRLTLDARRLNDVELLAIGGFSPLRGFMGEADYRAVVQTLHLADGAPFPMPVVLPASEEDAARLPASGEVALTYGDDVVAVLNLAERFRYDPREEARLVYRTEEEAHPGVAALYAQGPWLLGGEVTVLALPAQPFAAFRLTPEQSRAEFAARGWRTVVGFQTRNPVHRAHEYIQKCALEIVDGLFLHPLVGETKGDDVPAAVRMRCYQALLEHYYPRDRVLLAVNPAAMRYAGPREAVLHAVVRRNFGCTHFIVGRDHAGVGNYYGTYDAQRIFRDEFQPGELGIETLNFEHTFYCHACAGMASAKTCPHDVEAHVALSGTRVRQLLAAGELPPPEFSRPEVAQILVEAYRS
ncbi:MAG TPA: sulfate adenylyltransferase [Dehalococcoidia bacterium]|nr:sulfate adenylyltransferase [Dehalococcoidia bacterium]